MLQTDILEKLSTQNDRIFRWNVDNFQIGYVNTEFLITRIQSEFKQKELTTSLLKLNTTFHSLPCARCDVISVDILLANAIAWTWNIFFERYSLTVIRFVKVIFIFVLFIVISSLVAHFIVQIVLKNVKLWRSVHI